MKCFSGLVLLLLISATAAAAQPKLLLACPQADGTQIKLMAEPVSGGNRFYVEIDGRMDKAFTDMPDADFVGEIMLSRCIEHVLVFAIDYGPPYRKGIATRKRLAGAGVDRIDFAEKGLPRWLYVNPRDLMLVIPNLGHEVASPFLLYKFAADSGQPLTAAGIEKLPDKKGFKAVRIGGD